MEFQIQKDSSLQEKFSQISSLLAFVTKQLSHEENRLIRENLFYEKFLNKQLKAKKVISHNYAKTNQERKQMNAQSSQPSKPDINDLTVEVFENQISENIQNVIQKAQIALEEINDDPKPKFQKPAISPYEQVKPPLKKPPFGSGSISKNQQQAVVKEQPQVKKPLGHYVLHKQSTMQTTYNSTFNKKVLSSASQRSSSNVRSDPTAPTQSSAARKNSINSRNQTSFGNSLYQVQQEIPNQTKPNQIKAPINTNTKNINQIPSSQKKQNTTNESNKQKEKISLSDMSESSQSTQISIKNQQKQDIKIEPSINKNMTVTEKQPQTQVFETFEDDSDLFESMDKKDLSYFYNGKKQLYKSQKEYQQQAKYYKENEEKARNKFLCKLVSHFRERHLVTQGKLLQYEQSKQQENVGKNKNKKNAKKNDKYAEDNEEEADNNQQFNSFYEYTFVMDENTQKEDDKQFFQIKQLTHTMSALFQYGNIILANIDLNSQFEEILFLKSIKDDQSILEDSQNLSLLFKVWYFLNNLEKNCIDFRKINTYTLNQIELSSQHFVAKYFPSFLTYQNDNLLSQEIKSEPENEVKLIQFKFSTDKDVIRYVESQVINKFDHSTIFEINKQQTKIIMFQIIQKYIIQPLSESLISNVNNSSKINFKLFQQQLKLIRAISGIVEYSGKMLPSFFLTDSIEKYFENITD